MAAPARLRTSHRGYVTDHADRTYDVWDDDRPGARVAFVYQPEGSRYWIARSDNGQDVLVSGSARCLSRTDCVVELHQELIRRASDTANQSADRCEHCGGSGCMWCGREATALEVLDKWDADEAAIAAAATPPPAPDTVTVTLSREQWQLIHRVCDNAVATLTAVLGADAAAPLQAAVPVLADAAAGIPHT